jgi:hypothetical protein
MYVFCVGMNRAASTWQYNVVSDLVERHRGGRRLGFFRTGADFSAHNGTDPAGAWRILKTHDRDEVYRAALAEGRARAVYSYRDLRDLAYSLMHKCSASFDQVVLEQRYLHNCLDNDRFWTAQPGTLCQPYETMTTDPPSAVRELAIHLGLVLDGGEAEALAERYSLAANRRRAAALAQRLQDDGVDLGNPANTLQCDPHTQIHWNHIRDDRLGTWRERGTPRELAILAGICGDWLIERGYEPDYRWAEPALAEVCRELGFAQTALRKQQQELSEQTHRLANLEQLGPVAIGMARRLDSLARRFPRLSRVIGRLVRIKG